MADYIRTYGGSQFYPTNPDADKIFISDIAHALSLVCRGNGHVKTFFSVGQHCINCALEAEARHCSPRVIMACLLHDASEAYMSDVPRPFKKYLHEYNKFEEQLLDIIYNKFLGSNLTDDEAKLVKQIDDDLLYFDLVELLNEPVDGPKPDISIDISYEWVPFKEVENKYIELYNKYNSSL